MLELTQQQKELFEFVKEWHGTQQRKFTGAPYWTHLLAVANLVGEYGNANNEVEIALCHDLLEDTNCTSEIFIAYLVSLQYSEDEICRISTGVMDLTNVYTSERYPDWNRKKRKAAELERLRNIVYYAQTVKYADMIDNTESIVRLDPKFAKVYVLEQNRKVNALQNGNAELHGICKNCIESAMKAIE